jgi:ATP-dependent DNA helicase RecQ
VLALTEPGVALLKDPDARPDLSLARQKRVPKDRRPERGRPMGGDWKDVDHDLFDRLRTVRLRIARARGVPPYVIFHDTTLRELARLKPTTMEAFQQVYGIGVKKASQLGEAFLEEIRH